MHKHTTFRADINGLRAWAVMAVVLFHLGLGLDGGFVGVDVFFVISGYLMTAIIMRDLDAGKFSFFDFCLARARRIFPALITLVIVLLALGWFWLSTIDYKELGAQSVSSLTFLSNLSLRFAGYFDGATSDRWLLHTWSLSVEWQFYMLLPVFLMVLWKVKPGKKTAFAGMIFLFVASLIVSAVGTLWKPMAAYYLLPTRGWEMAAGGIVFFLSLRGDLSDKTKKVFQLVAWPALIASMFLFSSDYQWPGLWALFPVISTALLLLANNSNNPLVANPVAQWLGERSYSIYLWHWPLIVALHFTGVNNDPVWIFMAMIASLLFGHLSYQLVENKTRLSLSSLSQYRQFFAIGGVVVAVGLVALSVRLVTFEGRIPIAVDIAANGRIDTNPRQQECVGTPYIKGRPACIYGKSQHVKAIVIGDSHADSAVNAIEEVASKYDGNILFLGINSCPTIDDIKNTSGSGLDKNYCINFNNWAYQKVSQFSKEIPLILINRTSYYAMGSNGQEQSEKQLPKVYFVKEPTSRHDSFFQKEFSNALTKTACRLAKERPVYLVRPVPEFGIHIPNTLSRKLVLGQNVQDITIPMSEYKQRNSLVWAAQDRAASECGVKILNPLPYLCDDDLCYGSRKGRSLYYDDDHMNVYGSRFLMPMFEPVFAAPPTVSGSRQPEAAQQTRDNLS